MRPIGLFTALQQVVIYVVQFSEESLADCPHPDKWDAHTGELPAAVVTRVEKFPDVDNDVMLVIDNNVHIYYALVFTMNLKYEMVF